MGRIYPRAIGLSRTGSVHPQQFHPANELRVAKVRGVDIARGFLEAAGDQRERRGDGVVPPVFLQVDVPKLLLVDDAPLEGPGGSDSLRVDTGPRRGWI